MRTLNLAPLVIVKLINNAKCAWNLIKFTIVNCFHLIRLNLEYIKPFEKFYMDSRDAERFFMELFLEQIPVQDDPMHSDESSSMDSIEFNLRSYQSTMEGGLLFNITDDEIVYQPKPMYKCRPLKLIEIDYKKMEPFINYPSARSGHRVIANDGNLYSLGGYNPRRNPTDTRIGRSLLYQELWCYNFACNRWNEVLNYVKDENMPKELASNALAIYNNALISHGGTGYPFGETCSNDCYIYKIGKHYSVERLKVTGDLPAPLYGPGIVIHKNYLYTIGGTTGFNYSCDVYRLNLQTNVWEIVYISRPEMRDDPGGRYRHELVYDGKYIYVLGGGTAHFVYDLRRIPAFNLSNNTWDYIMTLPDLTLLAPSGIGQNHQPQNSGFPESRKCFSCVQHTLSNGDIEAFITGGLKDDDINYFKDIWKLNLRTRQWTLIKTAALPKPLYFHSAAHSNNGCMYIFGGIEDGMEDGMEEMRRRNKLYKMWMTIPKLSEMCWDAITYYNRSLETYKKSELLAGGIPKSFIERLNIIEY